MQSVTSLFNTLWNGSHRVTVKAVINDSITIGEDKITDLKTEGALFAENDFSFGGCISRQFEMSFYPGSITIPRMAKVQLYMRLTHGTQTSEWISKGVFYIDTRETDSNGLMKISGYDAMLKTEQDFIPTSTPQSMQATASQISTAIGVSLDSRCVFENYNCQLVTGYSMREILGFIAGVHGGNWIITDTGNLRLVRTSSPVDSFTITNRELMSYNKGSTYASVTKVIIHIDDETYVEAGDITGRTVEVTCPWATTAMAQALLTQLQSVTYTPCTATMLLHPAAEIGDKFLVSSVSHYVSTQTQYFNAIFCSDVKTPGEEEIDHEYPYKSTQNRKINRAIATVTEETAELRATTVEIRANVSTKANKSDGSITTFGYSLTADRFTLYSNNYTIMNVTASGATIAGWRIFGWKLSHPNTSGQHNGVGMYSTGGQEVASVWNSGTSPVTIYAGANAESPDPTTSNCYFAVLQDGSVYCKAIKATGADITGTIRATYGEIGGWIIDGQSAVTKRIYRSATTTSGVNNYDGVGMVYESAIVRPSLWRNESSPLAFYAGAKDDAPNPSVANDCYFGVLRDGSVYAQAVKITGELICDAGSFGIASVSDQGIRMTQKKPASPLPDIRTGISMVFYGLRGYKMTNGTITDNETIISLPQITSVTHLTINWNSGIDIGNTTSGAQNHLLGRWDIQETTSATPVTSDRTKKWNISPISTKYDVFFDQLVPSLYRYRDGTSNRTHTGYIAQEVETALASAGLSTEEFAGLCYDIDTYGEKTDYKLRYDEFISLNTWQIQKLKARVAHLEELLTAQGVQI